MLKHFFSVLFTVVFASTVFSQYCDFNNNDTTYIQPNFDFEDDCSNYVNYSPINTDQTQIKNVKITFFVIQDDQGAANFTNSSSDLQYLESIIDQCNHALANLSVLLYGTTPFIQDSRIRFRLVNIHFIPSSIYLNGNNLNTFRNDYIFNDQLNLGISSEEKFNTQHIIIYPYATVGGSSSTCGYKGYIKVSGWYNYNQNNQSNWMPYRNLIHEWGIVLG